MNAGPAMIDDPKPTSRAPMDGDPLPEGEEAPPAGTRTMALVRWALVALMAVLAAGAWLHYARERAGTGAAASLLYRCPMHPAIVQDRFGACPICGMDLVAAGASGKQPSVGPAAGSTAVAQAGGKYGCPMHPEVTSDDPQATCPRCGGMKLSPRDQTAQTAPDPGRAVAGLVPVDLSGERRQLMGMRTAKVARRRLAGSLRAVGFVSADEQKVAVVTARASGWVERLRAAQSGQRVKAGEVLLTLYSGELVSAQQAYVQNLRWKQNLASTPNANNPVVQNVDKDSLRRLQLYGMAQVDIDAVARSGEPLDTVPVRSPISGWVARKSVLPGQYVAAGTELYQLADLSTVWVAAELPEQDLARVAVGQKARLELAAYPGATFRGQVDFVYPAVNPESRTVEARMEFRNPDLRLRPGMYGDVLIEVGAAEALVVPAEAVVDTGELQYVFVARGEGRFEPRAIRLGGRGGAEVEVLSGLAAGDEVVTTANFYVDAESRLRAALEGRAAAEAVGVAPR